MFVQEMEPFGESGSGPGSRLRLSAPSGQRRLVCVSSSLGPGGSQCLSSEAEWPVVTNKNTRHLVKLEFQINNEFFQCKYAPFNICFKKNSSLFI